MSPWRKWVADLSGTRTQLTYLVVGLFAAAVGRGVWISSSVADIAVLLGAITPAFIAVLGYHFSGKWLEAKQNGTLTPP